MGGSESKEEVIIAQSASGDATVVLTKTDYLLIAILVIVVLWILWFLRKGCDNHLRRVMRQEIHQNEVRKSQEVLSSV